MHPSNTQLNVSTIAGNYAETLESKMISSPKPTVEILAKTRFIDNFALESTQYGKTFVERLTFGLLPLRLARSISVFLYNKKLLLNRLHNKFPCYKSYEQFKSQLSALKTDTVGRAGRLAESYLGSFSWITSRKGKPTSFWSIGRGSFVAYRADFQDSERIYEFKLCQNESSFSKQYRKAFVQTNLIAYSRKEFNREREELIIIEIFDSSRDTIYRYELKPDYEFAERVLRKAGVDISSKNTTLDKFT